MERYRITVTGTVQGVGFRPFIFGLARTHGLKGTVLNSGRGVIIDVEGTEAHLRDFMEHVENEPPSLSRITAITAEHLSPFGYAGFEILESASDGESACLVPPDVATCNDCRHDILNPRDRHYLYPFTNCTNCGPRFTITREIPYDRPKTSMAGFAMCDSCREEYENPGDRRFHAQPVACPECGPGVFVADRTGKTVADGLGWLDASWKILGEGKILALKGIGGFHLACDALNEEAVKELRKRKGRDAKPFAVMCRDQSVVREYCLMDRDEEALLTSFQAPIVVLRKKSGCGLPDEVARNLNTLGVMLPYSPFHILLFNGPFRVIVMTSGNYSNLPLVKDNEAAFKELGEIADYFLLHDREIVNRCDDSLTRIVDGKPRFLRRSRGYVPDPVFVPREEGGPVILGVGGEMKNNFCLLKGEQAFLSQYIGEIEDLEGETNLFESLHNFERLIGVKPGIVAFDMHPGYASSRVAMGVPASVHVPVQHHHAHLASCMAENMVGNEDVIGAILDGTGYGTDGHLWGFEFMTGNYERFDRKLHLAYTPLPGGEKAILDPWRTAYSYLVTFLGEEGRRYGRLLFADRDLDTIDRMIEAGFNSPLASGAGRLFDAVSAILGICSINSYEGQAAIELGEYAPMSGDEVTHEPYPFDMKEGVILPGRILRGVAEDSFSGLPLNTISTKFHLTVADIVLAGAEALRAGTGISKVALSGGTWQNPFLFRTAVRILRNRGFEVLAHCRVPTNDGGIALGQAMVAHWKTRERQAKE